MFYQTHILAAGLHLVQGVRPGRHRLGFQSLRLKGGGHLRPDHAHQILSQGHLLHRVPRQNLQHHLSVQVPRLKGLPLRLHSGGIIGEKLCLEGHYHRQGQGKQQHQQHRGDGGALVQIRMASHGNSSSFVPRLRACPFTVCARRAENEAGMDKQPFPWYTGF